jgi:hypothetical protein
MVQKEFQQDRTDSSIKTHEDIREILNELKSFEDKYKEYTIIEPEYEKEILEVDISKSDFIELEIATQEETNNLTQVLKDTEIKKIDKKGLINNITKNGLYSKFQEKFLKKIKEKLPDYITDIVSHEEGFENKRPLTSTNVFKMRFDDNGKLNIVDMRKPKPKPDIKFDIKKYIKFINKKEKEDKTKETPKDEDKSKVSAIKDKIVGLVDLKSLSKIKDIIPFISKKEEEKK